MDFKQIQITSGIYEVSRKERQNYSGITYCMKGSFTSSLTSFKDNAYIFIEHDINTHKLTSTYSLNNLYVTNTFEYTTNKPIPLSKFKEIMKSSNPDFKILN